jgi:Ca2+-binding EF-hand superfamily protein
MDRQAITDKITEAFSIFQSDSSYATIDIRELGTVIRSLGVFPSERQLHSILQQVEEDEPTGFVRLERFRPVMERILANNEIPRNTAGDLIQAFQVLDTTGSGELDPEEVKNLLTSQGEIFSDEEIQEFLAYAVDPVTHQFNYAAYARKVGLMS